MDLNDVLSDKEPEQPKEPEAPVEDVSVEKPESIREAHRRKEDEARGRDPETGKFVKKEEPKEEPKVEAKPEVKEQPKVDFSEKERALLKAAEEERRKRQALEAELAQYRQQPKKEEEKKTFWDDPEGHLKITEERIAARERNILLNVSEKLARSKYQDFDANIEVFAEILKTPAGPGIHAQFLAAPDPAEFAYRLGKYTREVRDAGNIDALREKIEKETRAKLEAEFKKKQEDLEKERQALPPSLSNVRGGAKPNQPQWSGPTPLGDILK